MIPHSTTNPPTTLERFRALRDPDTAGDYLAAAFLEGPESYVIAKQEIIQAQRQVILRIPRVTYH